MADAIRVEDDGAVRHLVLCRPDEFNTITIELRNTSSLPVSAAVCASLPNFIGIDGSETRKDWKGDRQYVGAKQNRNTLRDGDGLAGVFMTSAGVEPLHEAFGTIALATTATAGVTRRTKYRLKSPNATDLDADTTAAIAGFSYTGLPRIVSGCPTIIDGCQINWPLA